MHDPLQSSVEVYLSRRKSRSVFRKFVRVMSCIVAFVTTYALILPAITLEQTTFCQLDDHTHEESCYQKQIETHNLICTVGAELHIHQDSCLDEEGSLICGQADYIIHSHNDLCRNEAGELICSLPEHSVHTHDQSCYITPEPIPHVHRELCLVDVKGELTCTLEVSPGHKHTESCYQATSELLCTKTEGHFHGESCYIDQLVCGISTEPHAHSASCFTTGAQICTIPENHVHQGDCLERYMVCGQTEVDHVHNEECEEGCGLGHHHSDGCYGSRVVCSVQEGHTHGDSCYDMQLVCGKEAGEVHEHFESCYSDYKLLSCTLDENHIHVKGCYRQELACQTPESEGHDHEDPCYAWNQENGCGMEEGDPEPVEPELSCKEPTAISHDHDETCIEIQLVDAEPICGEEHEHTYTCYGVSCELQEHTHSLQCYSDPEADVESQQVWEAAVNHVSLTGDWYLDVIAIAESQLGYTESERNYQVLEDHTIRGYTRYGAWYGTPYEEWSATFAAFCLRFAGVDTIPAHASADRWLEALRELDFYVAAEETQPMPGCLVFLDGDGDGVADRVGIVAAVTEASEHMGAEIKTIEGDSENTVRYVRYAIGRSEILGYGFFQEQQVEGEIPEEMPDPLLEILICGIPSHIHEQACCDENDILLCTVQAHAHTVSCVDASSPVGYARHASQMTRARFAARNQGGIQYHDDVSALLSGIVILGADNHVVYNSNEPGTGSMEVTLGDMYTVELTFNEDSTDQFGTEQLHYTIPSYLATDAVSNGVILDGDGNLVATYTIIGNQLLVTPAGTDNFFEVHNDASFRIQFDAEAVFESDSEELNIDFNGQYSVTIKTNENGTLIPQKELVEFDPIARTLTFKCTTTAHGGRVNLSVISDYWWASGLGDTDVVISPDSLTLTDSHGNDVTNQWNIVINYRSDIWMQPWQPYYMDHGESITMTYQVQLSHDLTANFNYENTFYNYGAFESTPLEVTSSVRTPIAFTNIEKEGHYVAEDVNGVAVDALEWTVSVGNQNLEEIIITDQLSERQTFCQHQPMLIKARRPDAAEKEYIYIDWDQIDVDETNSRFVLTLPQGYSEYELIYYSHYQLEENGPSIQPFENTVTTNVYIGDRPTSDTAGVGVLSVLPRIDKQIEASDEDWVTFTIDCFMPAGLYDRTSVHLYDTLASWGDTDGFVSQNPANLTVTVTPVEGEPYELQPYVGQASAENTYLIDYDGQSFTMFFNTDQPQSGTSVWKCNVDSTLTVSYKVSLDSLMLDSWGGDPTEETLYQFLKRTGQGIDNNAQLNYSPTDYVSDSVHYNLPKEAIPPLRKTGTPVIDQDGVYEYSVWFNAGEDVNSIFPLIQEYGYYKNDVSDLILTDVYDSELEYVEGSLQASIWGYWNHKELVLTYKLPDGSNPLLEMIQDGKRTRMTVRASELIGQEGSNWLTGKSLMYALENLPEGYQYEFTYKLRVKEDVKDTSTEGVLYLDNVAEVSWTESGEPKTTGPAYSQVTYDTGILDKSMERLNDDSNLVSFTIIINHNALDLAPDSDTYILHDTMSSNLMLVYTSLEIEFLDEQGSVVGFRTPEQCGFAYNPDKNRMTFTLPDSQIIRLKYNCRVNGTGGDTVDVGNVVQLEGYSEIQDVVDTKFQVREHTGNADASSKRFVLQKQDAYSFEVLPGVSFDLYGDTYRAGSKTIHAGGKTLYYYETFTTDYNGMVMIAESQLSAEHLYALVEVAPLPGYLPAKEPFLFYMEHPPTGVQTQIQSIVEGALVVIQNVPVSYTLPKTGGAGTHWFVLGGLALCLLALAYEYRRRRRKDLWSP